MRSSLTFEAARTAKSVNKEEGSGAPRSRDNIMKSKYGIAGHAAILCLILLPALTAPVPAGAVTEREKQDCRADYQRYCKIYAVGSDDLRKCMSRSIRKLSHVCVDALVDAGEMTRAQANARRKSATHARSTRTRSHYVHKKRH